MPASKTVRACTKELSPLPSAVQLEPSHVALLSASTPPAVVKEPPAWSAGPLPSSYAIKAETLLRLPLIPLPSAAQLEPSHFAMSFAATPPADVKVPPA